MENAAWKLPLLNSYVEKWARERPDKPAMIQHEDGKTITYRQFNKLIDFFALRLLDMGIEKGDRVATMLVLGTRTHYPHVCLLQDRRHYRPPWTCA